MIQVGTENKNPELDSQARFGTRIQEFHVVLDMILDECFHEEVMVIVVVALVENNGYGDCFAAFY